MMKKLNMKLKTDMILLILIILYAVMKLKKAGKTVMSGYLENIEINPSEKEIIKIDMPKNDIFLTAGEKYNDDCILLFRGN